MQGPEIDTLPSGLKDAAKTMAVNAPAGHIAQLVPPLATGMYDPALHPALVHTT